MYKKGSVLTVKISEAGKIKRVKAMAGIFSSNLVVFLDGRIGVPFWENQLVHNLLRIDEKVVYKPEVLIYQVLPDIYTALRQTLHILFANYGRTFNQQGEKKDLQQALKIYFKLNEYFLGLRKGNLVRLYDRIGVAGSRILAQVGEQPRDENKKQAVDLATEIVKVLDSKKRVNPSAKLAQLQALKRRLENRINTIIEIEPKVVSRRQVLKTMIEICELRFKALKNMLKRLLPRLTAEYFDRHGSVDLRIMVTNHLRNLSSEIAKVRVKPFLYSAKYISDEINEAIGLIEVEKYKSASQVLGPTMESLKLRVVRTDMENFITLVTRLMFKPNRTLIPAEIKRINNGFRNLRSRLGSIDESHFKNPICKPALSFISNAESALKLIDQPKAGQLAAVKNQLTAAASML